MTRFLKRCSWALLLAAGLQTASPFSMVGPAETHQTSNLGYIRMADTPFTGSGWFIWFTDFSYHPKNLGEQYRWSVPDLYYSFDQSFLDYFGARGVEAVEEAIAIINDLKPVSAYSNNLSDVPLEESRVNYTASALHLFDLKSAALELLVERLGLADPERWTWALRARILPPGAQCPDFDYAVIQRNFDPITLAPSRYVNGNLFSYYIWQSCTPDIGDAEEFLVDPSLGTHLTALASPKISVPRTFNYGLYHTGLTRDDVGGLRYLYSYTNAYWEMAPPGALLLQTNVLDNQLLVTSNLTLLAEQALTNNVAALQALYPGLLVASSTNFFIPVVTTNVFAYFTNYPWSPAGPASLVIASNYTTNVQTRYRHSFANVVTNTFYTKAFVGTLITNVAQDPWGYPGVMKTNVTLSAPRLADMVSGDFYLIPSNWCGVSIVSTQLTTVAMLTNTPVVATNSFGVTNLNGQEYSESTIYYFTNHYLEVYPVLCETNSLAKREGVEKVRFIRRDYDSLSGRFFHPLTNHFSRVAWTNSAPVRQSFFRVVNRPDIVFAAADLAGSFPYIPTVDRSTPNFNNTNAPAGVAGPGTIEGPTTFTFNKVGPIYLNDSPFFLEEVNSRLHFIWASYDGSTNAPVIYPIGTSIWDLENQARVQIAPTYLPDGYLTPPPGVGTVFYSAPLQVTSFTPTFTPPYAWSLASGSDPLPPGLELAATGVISGTPTVPGFYEFIIRVTDGQGRTLDRGFSIRVNP